MYTAPTFSNAVRSVGIFLKLSKEECDLTTLSLRSSIFTATFLHDSWKNCVLLNAFFNEYYAHLSARVPGVGTSTQQHSLSPIIPRCTGVHAACNGKDQLVLRVELSGSQNVLRAGES